MAGNKRGAPEEWVEEGFPPEAKKIRRDALLEILDSDVDVGDKTTSGPGVDHLEDFVKTFDEEIGMAPSSPSTSAYSLPEDFVPVMEGEEGCGAAAAGYSDELDFLLEASDDDLGLPPTLGMSEEDIWESDGAGFGNLWGFEEDCTISDGFLPLITTDGGEDDQGFFVGGLFDAVEY